MASVPEVIPTNLPGRVVVRTGVDTQIPGAALLLGEMAYTTDTDRLYIGNESNSPPWIPTSQYEGVLDWSNVDAKFKSINVTNINGKSVADFVSTTIINTGQVLTVIKEQITKTVYGDGADFAGLPEAYAWLSQRTISSQGYVILQFPSIKIPETRQISVNHPNGDRIRWQGAPLKSTLPKYAELQVTGYSAVQQASDTAANLARLRLSFATEIAFTNGGRIAFGQNLGVMSNFLLTSDGSVAAGAEYTNGLEISAANVGVSNVAMVGFDLYGLSVQSGGAIGVSVGTYLYTIGNGGGGIAAGTSSLFSGTYGATIALSNGSKHPEFGTGIAGSDGALFAIYGFPGSPLPSSMYAAGNTSDGLRMQSCTLGVSDTLISTKNGQGGANFNLLSTGSIVNSQLTNNGVFGLNSGAMSYVSIRNGTVTGNGSVGVQASSGGLIDRLGATVSGSTTNYSPALNVTGNNNALIF